MSKPRGIEYELFEGVSAAGGKALHWWVERLEDRDSLFGAGGIFGALSSNGFAPAMPAHLSGVPNAAGKLAYRQGETDDSAMCVVFVNPVLSVGVLISLVIYWKEGREAAAQAKLSALPVQLQLLPGWQEIAGDLVEEASELAKEMDALAIALINVSE